MYLNSAIRAFDFGVNPDYVTSNNPLVRISEDGFKSLNQYLDNLSLSTSLISLVLYFLLMPFMYLTIEG